MCPAVPSPQAQRGRAPRQLGYHDFALSHPRYGECLQLFHEGTNSKETSRRSQPYQQLLVLATGEDSGETTPNLPKCVEENSLRGRHSRDLGRCALFRPASEGPSQHVTHEFKPAVNLLTRQHCQDLLDEGEFALGQWHGIISRRRGHEEHLRLSQSE